MNLTFKAALCSGVLFLSTTLSAATILPAIEGQVYNALHKAVPGALLELYIDDGDSVLGGGDTMAGSTTTDALGNYYFSSLDPDETYFVMHGGAVSAVQAPGEAGMIIDTFDTVQSVESNPLSGAMTDSKAFGDVLGGFRDLYLQVLGGTADAKLRSNPFNLSDNLQIDMASGVTGMAVVTWDGIDGTNGMAPGAGLNGTDLTHGGLYDGFFLRLAVDAAGLGQELDLVLHSESGTSTASVQFPVEPNVEPTGVAFVPFSDFVGGASIESVDALQMMVDANVPSLDAKIDMIGLAGAAQVNFAVAPEPGSAILATLGLLGMLSFVRRRTR